MTEFADLVLIGTVVKPQGRRGEVLVHPHTDQPERFPGLRTAFVPGPGETVREVKITSSWPHKQRQVLKIEGVDSINDAELLRGCEIRIAEDELAVLPEGSYYHHQLNGLRVIDSDDEEIGVVEDIMETGAGAPVLVVRGEGGETLLPLATDFVREVDLAGQRILIEKLEYFNAG